MMNPYLILKPKNLDLESRVRHNPPDFNFNYDYAYLIINNIITQTAYRMEFQKNKSSWSLKTGLKTYFISLCSTEMQAFYRDYNKHMNYLYKNFANCGRVLFKQNFREGKCFSYRINPKYSLDDLDLYLITDTKLIKKIKTENKNLIKDEILSNFGHLTKFFNPQKLTINLKDALEANRALFKQDNNTHKHFVNTVKILDLHNGKYRFTNNPSTDGRLHSSITFFPSHFRKFLLYEGKKLAEIDISSSIPFFLFILLKYIDLDNKTIQHIIQPTKSFYNSYILVKKSVALDKSEIEAFGNEVLKGNFYSQFEDEFWSAHNMENSHLRPDEYFLNGVKNLFGREFDGDEKDIEKVIKQNILSMLNAKPNTFRIEEAVFQMRYPTINNFIKYFKRQKYNDFKKHVKFSHLLLQFESYFMLKVIGKAVANRLKNVPFTTLHDCLITTQENAEKILELMQNTFVKEIGVAPNFKLKTWI